MRKFCPECGRRIEHCQGVEECASFVNFIEVKEKQDQQWEEVIKSLNCYSPIQLEIIKKMRELYPNAPTKDVRPITQQAEA